MALPASPLIEWVPTEFSLEPRWTREVGLELLRLAIRDTLPTQTVEVSFLAQGAFNKIYDVQTDSDALIMRVSLPVDPMRKTRSEVATMEWMHLNTSIPVPKVLAYQANSKNAIGFEWFLMTKMPGTTLAEAWRCISKLKGHLEEIFPAGNAHPEPSILHHDDQSQSNIMVDDTGKISGILDWECVSAMPLWKACDYPIFLKGRVRETEPARERYRHDDNGDPDVLYWEHLMDYELTMLRRCFINEMRKLEPAWIEIFDSTQTKRDFETAVRYSNGILAKTILRWIEDFENPSSTDVISLSKRMVA
ncbi:MAG: hypothetical protein M1829_005730 [Trizodia sp. TS-e1964]|nr:MAG: hypothetical protein M1829_005730 [Trizodia sp. TS-e1964]